MPVRLILLAVAFAATATAQPSRVGGNSFASPLHALAEALGGADRIDALETITVRSRSRVTQGDRPLTITSILERRAPSAARWTVRLPGVTRVTWIDDVRGAVVVGDSTRALSEAARDEAEAVLWLDPLVLAARRAELQAEVLADDLLRIPVPGQPDPLLVHLDADGRPSRISTFRWQGEERAYVEVVLRDYRAVDGVYVPHSIRQAVAGTVTGEQTIEAVQFGDRLGGAPFEEGDG